MLTLPDFREKKLVFIFPTQECEQYDELRLSNDNLALFKKGRIVNQIPCATVFCVFIIGDTTITTKLLTKLQEYGISVFILNQSLKATVRLSPSARGNYLLRERQFATGEREKLDIAQQIIVNKILNQHAVSKSLGEEIEVASRLATISDTDFDSLRGIEGSVAAMYFKAVFADIGWYRRAPQVKEDIPNLLLDIGYTFLFNLVSALLELFGFDTYRGYFHRLFFQRESLTCDLMEPMRCIIEKQLYKSYHLKQINEADFRFTNDAFCIKDWERRKKYCDIFSQAIMSRKEDIYQYIYAFYRYVMDDKKYPYQPFLL